MDVLRRGHRATLSSPRSWQGSSEQPSEGCSRERPGRLIRQLGHCQPGHDGMYFLRFCLPVQWNVFLAAVVDETAWLASHREKLLENVAVENTAWVFGGAVGHEVLLEHVSM